MSEINFASGVNSDPMNDIRGHSDYNGINLETSEASNLGIKHIFTIEYDPETEEFIYQVINGGPLGDFKPIFTIKSREYISDIEYDKDNNPQGVLWNELVKNFNATNLIDINFSRKDNGIIKTVKKLINNPLLLSSEYLKLHYIKGNDSDPKVIEGTIKLMTEPGKYFKLDYNEKYVYMVKVKQDKDGYYEDEKPFLSAYPTHIEILQSPLTSNLRYGMTVISNVGNYPIKIGPGSPSKILETLKENGLVLNGYRAEDNLNILINLLNKGGYVHKNYQINNPGFFYIHKTDTIMPVGFECDIIPTKDDVGLAVDELEDFGNYHNGVGVGEIDQRDKLASIFKLVLTTPFDYVRKQKGYSDLILPPMLYGQPGSGKTSFLMLPTYLYDLDVREYEKGGSNVQTPARFAEMMGKGTFPTLVDECANIFIDREMVEMNKTGLRGLEVRNKLTKRGDKIVEPAYSTFLYASNDNPIKNSQDGTSRRYFIIPFDVAEHKDEDSIEVNDFKQRFKTGGPDCTLKKLVALGRFAAYQIINNQSLLEMKPTDLGDLLVKMMYEYVERDLPETHWLNWWAENEDIIDFQEFEKEIIISYIKERIMAERKYTQINNIGETKGFQNEPDFKGILRNVAKSQTIPWLFHKQIKGNEYFCIKPSFITDLEKAKNLSISLKSLSQYFKAWEYANTRDSNNKQGKVIRIPSEVFYNYMID